jgi:hypothetical protein
MTAHCTLGLVSAVDRIALPSQVREKATNAVHRALGFLRSSEPQDKAQGSAEAYLTCVAFAYSDDVLGCPGLGMELDRRIRMLAPPSNLEAKAYQLMFAMSSGGVSARAIGHRGFGTLQAVREFELLDRSLPRARLDDLRLTLRLAIFWSKGTQDRPLVELLPELWPTDGSTSESSLVNASLYMVASTMFSFRNAGPTSGLFWPLSVIRDGVSSPQPAMQEEDSRPGKMSRAEWRSQ